MKLPLSSWVTLVLAATSCAGPAATPAKPVIDRIGRVTHGLIGAAQVEGRAPEKWSLPERMTKYHIPGVSIAVSFHGRNASARL